MKLAKIAATLAGVAFVFAAASCDLAGDSESTSSSSSSGSSSSISDPSATAGQTNQVTGYVPIDAFTQIQWATVQEEDGTRIVIDDGSTEIDPGNYPVDQTPQLYFDVYFSTASGTLFNNDNKVESFDAAEEASNTYSVSVGDLEDKLNVDQLTIGQTYYWGVVVLTQDGETLCKVSNSVTIAPPVNYSNVTLAYDFNGWYLTASFPAIYETTVADLYFGTTGAGATAVASGIHAYESAGSTVFKAYLAAAPLAETTYYAYMIAKDTVATDAAIATKGEVDRIEPRPSVSAESQWNIRDNATGTVFITSAARESGATNFTLAWDSLVPTGISNVTYTAEIATANTMTSPTLSVSDLSSTSVAISRLSAATTYYARITATSVNKSYTETWTSPVVSFATPAIMASPIYTFNTGSTIPAAAGAPTDVPGYIVTNGTVTSMGGNGGGAALSLASTNSIATTLSAAANKYTYANLKFDFSPNEVLQDCLVIVFDNQSTFNPDSYGDATTSYATAAATGLVGPMITIEYAVDPDDVNTPLVFAVYAYVPYFFATGDYRIERNRIANLATISNSGSNPGIPTGLNQYYTLNIAINSAAETLTIAVDGTSMPVIPFSSIGDINASSIYFTGLKGMRLTALNPILVDNVSYTAELRDAAGASSPYMPSRR